MKRSVFYAVIAIIAFGVIIGISFNRNRPASQRPGARKVVAAKKAAKVKRVKAAKVKRVKGEFDIHNAFIDVAERLGPAIVSISTERTAKIGFGRPPQMRFKRRGPNGSFGEEDPFEKFFEDFFGQLPEKEFKQRGLGSGFIIDKKGHILTNHHVIDGADTINVTLPDGRSFIATARGSDPVSDLAVIKIEAKNLPVAELGNSDLLQVGEWVVALGNPFGHVLKSAKPTVTVGVISALHRRIPAPGGGMGYLDMIQTDAAINPGNSGGPLCDLNGNVIGINVVIFSTSGGYQGMGFAIPINMVKEILGDLVKGKEIAYGWLGVSIQEVTADIAEYFKLEDRRGALISEVLPDGPAKDAGLKAGDIIIVINGKPIKEVHDLLKEIGNAKVGREAEIIVIREGARKTVKVKIGKRPLAEGVKAEAEIRAAEETKMWRGIKVIGLTEEIAHDLGLRSLSGVVIIEVDPMSSGYGTGLRKGDVVREINKARVRDLEGYKKIIAEVKGPALIKTDKGYFIVKEDKRSEKK